MCVHIGIFLYHYAGKPVYIAVTLAEMRDFGGGDSESLETAFRPALDVVFTIPSWRKRLISVTADGANVNFGQLTGFLTQLADYLPWLIKTHCANHRIELAVKHVFKESAFYSLDEHYIALYNYLFQSGKAKSLMEKGAANLGIQYYQLPKFTGTRFVGHRRASFKAYLGNKIFYF